jgi:D-sedoheptulose 7-phosphate isomerase
VNPVSNPANGANPNLFTETYLASVTEVLARIDARPIATANAALQHAYERGAWVFIAGNGGSASLASHMACDFEKTVSGKDPRKAKKRFRVQSLVDNVAKLTAWANDETFDCVFSEPLRTGASEGDVLVVISASGNSPNVVEALQVARAHGIVTIGLLGFDGGKAMALCDHPILVPCRDYGLVEGAHGVLSHMMTSWLTHAIATENHRAQVIALDSNVRQLPRTGTG